GKGSEAAQARETETPRERMTGARTPRTRNAPPLPCADGVSNLVSPGGRQMLKGYRLPLHGRGVHNTLGNGVRTLNEVETFPRHHEQRRANPCTSAAGPPSSDLSGLYGSLTTASSSSRTAPN